MYGDRAAATLRSRKAAKRLHFNELGNWKMGAYRKTVSRSRSGLSRGSSAAPGCKRTSVLDPRCQRANRPAHHCRNRTKRRSLRVGGQAGLLGGDLIAELKGLFELQANYRNIIVDLQETRLAEYRLAATSLTQS